MSERSEQRETGRLARHSAIPPGWYRDPAAPETQRYWNGEEWLGDPIPADATPPSTPPVPQPSGEATSTPTGGVSPSGAPGEAPGQTSNGAGQAPPAQVGPFSPAAPPAAPGQAPPAGVFPGLPPKLAGFPIGTPAYQVIVDFMNTHRKAPLARRLAARLIDIIAVLALNVVVNGWFMYQYVREIWPLYQELFSATLAGRSVEGIETATERSSNLSLAIVVISVALWFAYEVPALAHDGQTFGKRVAGIRVARLDGAPRLGFATAFRRWSVMAIPNFLFPCGVILQALDSLWCTWDRPLEQCYHDKVARTAVVIQDRDQPDSDQAATGAPDSTRGS